MKQYPFHTLKTVHNLGLDIYFIVHIESIYNYNLNLLSLNVYPKAVIH